MASGVVQARDSLVAAGRRKKAAEREKTSARVAAEMGMLER